MPWQPMLTRKYHSNSSHGYVCLKADTPVIGLSFNIPSGVGRIYEEA